MPSPPDTLKISELPPEASPPETALMVVVVDTGGGVLETRKATLGDAFAGATVGPPGHSIRVYGPQSTEPMDAVEGDFWLT